MALKKERKSTKLFNQKLQKHLRIVGFGVGLNENVIDACVFKLEVGNNVIGITIFIYLLFLRTIIS